MYSKILILRFPKTTVQKPIVCFLTKKFDLTFNILNAKIYPRKEGRIVLEVSGNRKNFKKGVRFLKDEGVVVQNADQEIKRDEDCCTHFGTCTAVCPTGALHVQRPDMYVRLDQEKCSLCELCLTVCPVRVISLQPIDDAAIL